jgi:molecular chaperone GrpE
MVVQVRVRTGEKGLEEDSQRESAEHLGEMAEAIDHEKKEPPLDKMTKVELLKKLKQVQESAEKNFDLYARSLAELDNMKKRFQKEKEDLIKFSNESLIKQLLTIIDNLEMATAHSQNENSLSSLAEGVELTLKGLTDTLEKAGLEKVNAVGKPFDPNFHAAVSAQEDHSVDAGTVLQELQKGYTLNQRLIRPAMVIISKKGPDATDLN